MLHKRADRPHVKLPREDRAPVPLLGCQGAPHSPSPRPPSHCQWSASRRGLLLVSLRPGCALLWDHSVSAPFLSPLGPPHGGDTQVRVGSGAQRWAAVTSPGWGRLGQWVAMATLQALPQGPLSPGRGPCPCLQGAAHPGPAHSIPGPPNSDLAPTVCQALRL